MEDCMSSTSPAADGAAPGEEQSSGSIRGAMGYSQKMLATSTEWTDEKHSQYISSVEASFLNQMFRGDYDLVDSLGNLPPNVRNSLSSDQFKVLQNGSWSNHQFQRPRNRAQGRRAQFVSTRPWIQRLMPPSITCGRPSGMALDRTGAVRYGSGKNSLSSNPRGSTSTHPQNFSQDTVGSIAEVSDQNFVDTVLEGALNGSTQEEDHKNRFLLPKMSQACLPSANSSLL